jgi:hypothetical protein
MHQRPDGSEGTETEAERETYLLRTATMRTTASRIGKRPASPTDRPKALLIHTASHSAAGAVMALPPGLRRRRPIPNRAQKISTRRARTMNRTSPSRA